MPEAFDVICLGAGPAGEALASELKGSGLTLATVERNLVGGECPYWGCMPSKTMLRSAEVLTEAGRARELASDHVDYDIDYPKVHARVRWMTRDLDDTGAAKSIEENGARLFRGEGRLVGPREVEVDGRSLRARRAVVIATGTSPAMPPLQGLDKVEVWTNRDAVQSSVRPRSLAVLGIGAVGAELAQAWVRLGTELHLVESGNRPLMVEEPEAGHFLQERFLKEGMEIYCSARAQTVEQRDGKVVLGLADGSEVAADRLLVATGRKANLDGFDLAAAGVKKTDRGWVKVDDRTLEAADGIYAAGDVNGIGGFTHLADYHGHVIGRRIKGEDAVADHAAVPRVTFTDPEVASVGLTEQQARDKGIDVVVASSDVGQSARGYIHGEPGGLVKLVADRKAQRLVGVTLVSPRAGEMISEFVLALRAGVPLDVLKDVIHPFPTFSRILQYTIQQLG